MTMQKIYDASDLKPSSDNVFQIDSPEQYNCDIHNFWHGHSILVTALSKEAPFALNKVVT